MATIWSAWSRFYFHLHKHITMTKRELICELYDTEIRAEKAEKQVRHLQRTYKSK